MSSLLKNSLNSFRIWTFVSLKLLFLVFFIRFCCKCKCCACWCCWHWCYHCNVIDVKNIEICVTFRSQIVYWFSSESVSLNNAKESKSVWMDIGHIEWENLNTKSMYFHQIILIEWKRQATQCLLCSYSRPSVLFDTFQCFSIDFQLCQC